MKSRDCHVCFSRTQRMFDHYIWIMSNHRLRIFSHLSWPMHRCPLSGRYPTGPVRDLSPFGKTSMFKSLYKDHLRYSIQIYIQIYIYMILTIYIYACTSSTAQGGGGSFKNRKPIGEVGCCESRMAERSHWWTDRWLMSPLFLSLSLTIYLPTYLSIYLCIYRSI